MPYFNPNLPTIICTDAEPDDLLAIAVLLPRLRNKDILIVTGEQNGIKDKLGLIHEVIMETNPDLLVQGVQCHDSEVHSDEETSTVLRSFIQKAYKQKCNVFSLKPPFHLLPLAMSRPSVFRNCVLYAYGSSNVRKVITALERVKAGGSQDDIPPSLLQVWRSNWRQDTVAMLEHFYLDFYPSCFQESYYFESFSVMGQDNTLEDVSELGVGSSLKKAVAEWNSAIKQKKEAEIRQWVKPLEKAEHYLSLASRDTAPSLEDCDNTSSVHRAIKIIHSVTQHPYQLLLADAALAASVLVPSLVEVRERVVSFDPKTGYSKCTEPEDEDRPTCWVFQAQTRDRIVEALRLLIHT